MFPVGMDISDQAIRFIKFSKNKGGLKPVIFGEEKMPKGVIVSGEITKKEELIKTLSSLRRKFNLTFVKVSLPEEKAYFFKTKIPNVRNGEIRQSIEFRLEENVPIRAGEALFDCVITDKDLEKSELLDIAVSVIPKKIAENYSEALEMSGLTPVSFEVESKAIVRSTIKDNEKGTIMIVNIRERVTVVTIVVDGTIRFTSAFSIGGGLITEAISKNFLVSLDDAEKIKNKKLYVENKESIAIFFSLSNIVSAIKDEIGKFYAYWISQNDSGGELGSKINKIILCGKDSAIIGFKEYLSQSLKINVEIVNVWQNNIFNTSDNAPEIHFLDSLNFAVAIGLAIPQKN